MSDDAGPSSGAVYDWGVVVDGMAGLLGCRARRVGRPGHLPVPDTRLRALALIQEAVEDGRPALVWNLAAAEFGVVYGFDDDARRFVYRCAGRTAMTVPYDGLGRSAEAPELFVATLGAAARRPAATREILRGWLTTVTTHARGLEPALPGYTGGLAAYDVWIGALRRGVVEAVAHAYHIALLAEAREHAARFLDGFTRAPFIQAHAAIRQPLESARGHFEDVHRGYRALYPSFPQGLPGVRTDAADLAVDRLAAVRDAEARGIADLETMLRRL